MVQHPAEDGDENIGELVRRCRSGDQQAATALFNRYVGCLIQLVREKLSQRFSSRMDPEDVLQSAYRSFFNGLGNGEFKVEHAEELWGLLSAITLNKLYRKLAYHTAKKHTINRERPPATDDGMLGSYPELIAELPTPSEAAGLIDELEQAMQQFGPLEREIVRLRLAGHSVDEIAVEVKRTDRTIRRTMEKLRVQLQRRLMHNEDNA